MKLVVCFVSPRQRLRDIKHTTRFINTVCNENSFQILYLSTLSMKWAFVAGAASKAGDADCLRAPGLTSGVQGYVMLYCWCHSDSASVLLYFTYLFNTKDL